MTAPRLGRAERRQRPDGVGSRLDAHTAASARLVMSHLPITQTTRPGYCSVMPITDSAVRAVLKNQYHAALAMLREGVERCPAEEWSDTRHKNAFWQLAYHTLFFTHLYLQQNEA